MERGALQLNERRARLGAAVDWCDALILFGAGEPVPIPNGDDQTYPFFAHAEFVLVAGEGPPGAVVAFDPRDGAAAGWNVFVPPVTEAERVWEGRQPSPGLPLPELAGWLAARRGRPIVNLGAPLPGIVSDTALATVVREALRHARRAKDADEIALLRCAAAATAAGFATAARTIRPGVAERAVRIELEAEFLRVGATRVAFDTIVGTGSNAAVLHFAPSHRAIAPGDFVLIDAGAEVHRYASDVTRTFVAGTPASPWQRDLYALVLEAQHKAIAGCTVGAEWKDVHLATAEHLVAGLVALGLMRGDPGTLVEREAHTLFFPHGLGHLVGLGVRDASGLAPGRTRDPRPQLRTLRMDLPLAAGYVTTVEPGLYFIRALLEDCARRERFRDCVVWERVDPLLDLGGVRIEDNVLVTPHGPEVLTAAIPKRWDDIALA